MQIIQKYFTLFLTLKNVNQSYKNSLTTRESTSFIKLFSRQQYAQYVL